MGRKVVYIATDLITEMIRQGAETHCLTVEGLPRDAKFAGTTSAAPPRLGLVYESAEWPELPEGSVLPEQTIHFKAMR